MGSTIWITGANRGLGYYVSQHYLGKGHNVVPVGREWVDLWFPPEEIERQFGHFMREIRDGERPDVFIHCAGLLRYNWLEDQPVGTINQVMMVNCISRMILNSMLLEELGAESNLCIIHVGSVAAHMPIRTGVAYAASKAADEMHVKSLALETAERYPNLDIFGVNPGTIDDSDMQRQGIESLQKLRKMGEQVARNYARKSVLGRHTSYKEVTDVIAWLVDEAPRHLHGQFITMAGGLSI